MAKDTLGRRIVERDRFVPIFGFEHELNAEVVIINSFSGHADKNELRRYVATIGGSLKKIAVVHGEESQSMAFAGVLRALKPHAEVVVPEYQQVMKM